MIEIGLLDYSPSSARRHWPAARPFVKMPGTGVSVLPVKILQLD